MCVKKSLLLILFCGLLLNRSACAEGVDLKRDGAFGFPQAQARVLYDHEDLRVSAWSNAEYLYVQAIVWGDGDETLGELNGRKVGDFSQLLLDIDADQHRTPTIDRTYTVGSYANVFGLRYQVAVSERGSTPLQADSKGRGSIKYVDGTDGKRIRVDSFLIPLTEIGKRAGETIRLAHFARSMHPELNLNSVGFESTEAYFSSSLPMDKYHELTIADGAAFDPKLVPEGREEAGTQPSEPAPVVPELVIGSRAPELDIEHWVQNGKGKFEPVTEFAPNKVYIVEFWATWCGPCIAAMPHIAELQNKYADQGLQVVSISDEKLDIVEKFLEKKAPAEKDKEAITYGELTSQYCLTTDPDRSNHTNYMKAARQNGIPCAFVVGKDGLIEWIGHPMAIDKALASVVAGNWDRAAFAVEYKQEQELREKSSEIMSLAQKSRFEEALALATEVRDSSTAEAIKQRAESLIRRVRSIEVEQHILKNSETASAKLEALLEGRPYSEVNNFVWSKIVEVKERGRKISDELLATATRLTEKAVDAAPEVDERGVGQKAYLLDTYAHLLHLQGQLDKAIEVQRQALEHVDEAGKNSVEDYLKTLLELKNPSQLTGDLLVLQGKWRVTFADGSSNVFDIDDRTFTMAKHSPSGIGAPTKFSFTIDENQSPKQMTWLRPGSSGQKQDFNRSIYELHGDTGLLSGGLQERPSKFVSGEGKPHTTWILKREKVAND